MFFRDDSETPKFSLNGRQKLFILGIDLAIVIELCIAMAQASATPDSFTPSFMKVFFAMFLPTLLAGFYGHRKLRDNAQSPS